MKIAVKSLLLLLVVVGSIGCNIPKKDTFKPIEVYKSEDLTITQISENAYQHTSYLQTNDFGKVPCNGLIVKNNKETAIFDTPTNDTSALALINWVKNVLHCNIIAVIPTHFHDDCLGGLKAFHQNNIPSYAYFKTIAFAKENNFAIPQNSFLDSLSLKVGKEKITAKFFGEGHTKDNVIGYFASDNIMFGGCLIKELDATKGYLGDANVTAWSNTVEKVRNAYPNVKIVIPGHGNYGDKKLLDYTINLFKNK